MRRRTSDPSTVTQLLIPAGQGVDDWVVSRLVTHRLPAELLPARVDQLATLIADNKMNLCHVARAVGAQPRAVRRWVKVALERGIDVIKLARRKLKERGVDAASLPAERVRRAMAKERRRRVSDRSDTSAKARQRPAVAPVRKQKVRRVPSSNSANSLA